MSVNKYQEHIFVIPEDDADRQIVNGFVLHDRVDVRRIQVVDVARGWNNVLTTFQEEYIPHLRRYPHGHVVLLIDFDGQAEARMATFREAIPDDLQGRVFVVGSLDDPETLKAALNLELEHIGRSLAEHCALGDGGLWDHEQLRHNADERQRLATVVPGFLFA